MINGLWTCARPPKFSTLDVQLPLISKDWPPLFEDKDDQRITKARSIQQVLVLSWKNSLDFSENFGIFQTIWTGTGCRRCQIQKEQNFFFDKKVLWIRVNLTTCGTRVVSFAGHLVQPNQSVIRHKQPPLLFHFTYLSNQPHSYSVMGTQLTPLVTAFNETWHLCLHYSAHLCKLQNVIYQP